MEDSKEVIRRLKEQQEARKKEQSTWRRAKSNDKPEEQYTVMDSLIDQFLSEFEPLVRAALKDETRKEELNMKFEAINSLIVEGHQYFKDELFNCWKSFNPKGVNVIYARAAIDNGSMKELLRYTRPKKVVKKPHKDPAHWKNEETGERVKAIFEKEGITKNGKYNPDPTRSKANELLIAYYILLPLLKVPDITNGAKWFFNEFNAPITISDTALRAEPKHHTPKYEKMRKLFALLLPRE